MESLKRALAQIAAQMRGMALSQRLVLLLGAALVAGSLLWIAQWAAKPEMVPLLEQDLEPEELASVRAGLDTMNELFSVIGSRIYVKASANRPALLAQLQQMDRMPMDTSTGFAALVEESNPWISQSEQKRRWTVALQSELENVLSTFEGVKHASVFLNIEAKQRLVERNPTRPTASVKLEMKGGEPVSRALARSAARLVAGAVGGLTPERVEVVDSLGRTPWNPEEDAEGSTTQIARQRTQWEHDVAGKIRALLADPYVRVGVNVSQDFTARDVTSETVSDPVEVETENTTLTETSGYASQEPGVRVNTGTSDMSSGHLMTNKEQTSNTTRLAPSTKIEHTTTPRGEVKHIFAAISLSDHYLANIYRKRNPDAGEPTAAQLETMFKEQEPRIVDQVMMLVKRQGDELADQHIDVNWHYEVTEAPTVVEAGAVDDALGWARRYGPQSGLALLALVSLAMMLRMARRSQNAESFGLELGLPEDAIAAARQAAQDLDEAAKQRKRRTKRRGDGDEPEEEEAPQATYPRSQMSDGMLTAQEVDETSIQMNKMLEQVSTFVDSDPEIVANLIERWIASDD